MTAPDIRTTLTALIQAAAAGKPDAAWIDEAIRKAGYVRREERVTKAELAKAVSAIIGVMEETALFCGETCGENMMDHLMQGITRVERIGSERGPEGADHS
jgi:protein-disulfide isomerase-like protein with CxxC motif